MLEFIFTIDYELYGDGTGSLKELVYDPTERLRRVFDKHGARFVTFVEVAELAEINAAATDAYITAVEQQLRELHQHRYEIGLHLHPQWFNARHQGGRWLLDFSNYNLCTLPRQNIEQIVDRGLQYLRNTLGKSEFTPLSFRAGNWLFQPTSTASRVLADRGIRIDSSVFKGGLQHNHNLDYRGALKNGFYWKFQNDVVVPHHAGPWIEVPIYTRMVASWKLLTQKRIAAGNTFGGNLNRPHQKLNRLRDFLRLRYPLKFDFCRMTLDELRSMLSDLIRQDEATEQMYKPVVAIGHTKDRIDYDVIDRFLDTLNTVGMRIGTFQDAYPRLAGTVPA